MSVQIRHFSLALTFLFLSLFIGLVEFAVFVVTPFAKMQVRRRKDKHE